MGCVYCKEQSDEVKLSISDIIPDALTNNKITFNNVCEEEHNNKFSKDFEQTIIKQLAIIRNRLFIFSSNRKGKTRAKFPARIKFEDYTFETTVSTKYDFFNSKPKYGKTSEGKGMIFIPLDSEDIDKSKFTDLREIDINSCEFHIQFDINHGIFYSHEMKRLIAKIGYEWFCKETNTITYDIAYSDIVDFIVTGSSPPNDIVKIVCDQRIYSEFDKIIDVGGHALGTYYSSNGDIYVYVSFFNIIIYRVTIYKSPIKFSFTKMIHFYGNWADGVEVKFKVGIKSGQGFEVCDTSASEFVDKRINYALNTIFNQYYFALKSHRYIVIQLKTIITGEDEEDVKFNKMLGFKEDEKLITLSLLHRLGEKKELYDSSKSFNENLRSICSMEDDYSCDEVYKQLKELFYDSNLKSMFLIGCDIFLKAYDDEIVNKNADN